MSKSQRLPSLDGLRAISIGMVLLSHLTGTAQCPVPAALKDWFYGLGALGVRCFFVISGYLITGILLRELARSDGLQLTRFYFRRTLRLFPAFYALIGVVLLLRSLGWLSLAPGDLLHAFTYTMNYHAPRGWWLGHSWSLAVEEQFYLAWPALLLLLGRRRALGLAFAFVAFGPLIRIGNWYLFPASRDSIGETFHTVADAIAAGCVLAGAQSWLAAQPRYRRLADSPLPWLLLGAAFAGSVLSWKFDLTLGPTLLNLALALCLDWCLRHPDGRMGAFLNARLMVAIGVGSYSLYLWQELFVYRKGTWAANAFPLNLVLTGAVATLSYFLVEKPFLRLRERLEPRLFPR